MRLPVRPARSSGQRLAAGRLSRAGGSQGSSLLDEAQAHMTPALQLWRWQVASLSLALCRTLGRELAAVGDGMDRERLAEDVGLYLARYCMGYSLRDLAAMANQPKATVCRAIEAVERLADGERPPRYGLRRAVPGAVLLALAGAEGQLQTVRERLLQVPSLAGSAMPGSAMPGSEMPGSEMAEAD